MPDRFFDKIKLFKGAEIQPGRPAAEPGEEEKGQPPGRGLIGSPWFFLDDRRRRRRALPRPPALRGPVGARPGRDRPGGRRRALRPARRGRRGDAQRKSRGRRRHPARLHATIPTSSPSPRTRSGASSPRAGTGPPRPPGTVPRRSSGRSSSTSWASTSRPRTSRPWPG
ncbi:MAG: hypothetical protein M0C28_42625 [Candidatus Moduliflexus flocculans]|nr:hypothetical protein [Candidatus Moduliflexus flocculans]